jgi:hypothetical protein
MAKQRVGTDTRREPVDNDFWRNLLRGIRRHGSELERQAVERVKNVLRTQSRFNVNDAPHDRLPSLIGISRGRRYNRQAERL